MNPEVALLAEVWEAVHSHVPRKERLLVAEHLVRLFDEHVDISEIKVSLNEFDNVLKTAVVSHFDLLLGDDEDDDDQDSDDGYSELRFDRYD